MQVRRSHYIAGFEGAIVRSRVCCRVAGFTCASSHSYLVLSLRTLER